MDLIIDANIVFAALIKEGFSSKLILNDNLNLFSTDFLVEETERYLFNLLEKSKRDVRDFIRFEEIIHEKIKIISRLEFSNLLEEAKNFCPDSGDLLYFALALHLNCPIWSNDKKLKEQNRIKVYSSHDLLELLK